MPRRVFIVAMAFGRLLRRGPAVLMHRTAAALGAPTHLVVRRTAPVPVDSERCA